MRFKVALFVCDRGTPGKNCTHFVKIGKCLEYSFTKSFEKALQGNFPSTQRGNICPADHQQHPPAAPGWNCPAGRILPLCCSPKPGHRAGPGGEALASQHCHNPSLFHLLSKRCCLKLISSPIYGSHRGSKEIPLFF